MRFISVLLFILIAVGCGNNDIVQCSVTWYDDTVKPKRELARYNFDIEKGQEALLSRNGMEVQFEEGHKVKVRLFWNEEGIFTEVYSLSGNLWKSEIMEMDFGETQTHRFQDGIMAEAVMKK